MASHWPRNGRSQAPPLAIFQKIGLFHGISGLAWRQLKEAVPAITRHDNENTKQKMKADNGNQVYDRNARNNARAGDGPRLVPATASSILTDTTSPWPAYAFGPLTPTKASRRRSPFWTENQDTNKRTKPIKMKTMKNIKNILFTVAGLALLPAFPSAANELPEHHKKLYGEGLCAKCELKESEKCQTAIRVTEGDGKVVYYAKDNDVAKAFHPKICKSVAPVKAVGNVQEKDGKRHITLMHIEVREF
jgi:hypothetical protein